MNVHVESMKADLVKNGAVVVNIPTELYLSKGFDKLMDSHGRPKATIFPSDGSGFNPAYVPVELVSVWESIIKN